MYFTKKKIGSKVSYNPFDRLSKLEKNRKINKKKNDKICRVTCDFREIDLLI